MEAYWSEDKWLPVSMVWSSGLWVASEESGCEPESAVLYLEYVFEIPLNICQV